MTLTRRCRWCPKTFEVLTSFSNRWHCPSCWTWITLDIPGVSRSKGFTIIGKPLRFRNVEEYQERLSADTIGK